MECADVQDGEYISDNERGHCLLTDDPSSGDSSDDPDDTDAAHYMHHLMWIGGLLVLEMAICNWSDIVCVSLFTTMMVYIVT